LTSFIAPAWIPPFLAAGGLVMVVGVHEATSRRKISQRIRLDGSSGEIVVVNGSDASVLA